MRVRIFILIAACLGAFATYLANHSEGSPSVKLAQINGASLVSPYEPVSDSVIATVKRVNAGWVAIIPFGFARQGDPMVYFNHERQWWGEKVDGTAKLITMAHRQGLKVMLKPQIWMRESWIGNYQLDSDEKWAQWEESYSTFIKTFAHLADSLDVELFCIGTELKTTETTRKDFWTSLIRELRKSYSGKLTYAANWDTYQAVPFWAELDFIGVNAYFPLTQTGKEQDSETIATAWIPIKKKLKATHEAHRKPVLFTEFGYASCNQATERPWEEFDQDTPNVELQARAYECLFNTVWGEEWMAGGFFWKWHLVRHPSRWEHGRFTPQEKPAEDVIRKWYAVSGQ